VLQGQRAGALAEVNETEVAKRRAAALAPGFVFSWSASDDPALLGQLRAGRGLSGSGGGEAYVRHPR